MRNKIKYQFNVCPVSEEDGGGYFVEFPELQGCYTSGGTLEETISKIHYAIETWINVTEQLNKTVPEPRYYNFDEGSI